MHFYRLPALAFALALTACGGDKLDASYEGTSPGLKGTVLTLKPNGKAVYMGTAVMEYEVKGMDVLLHQPQGTILLKGHEDGSLDFPILGNLKKQGPKT